MISQYRSLIVLAAAPHQLDPQLVEAVVWQESSDDPVNFLRYEPLFYRKYILHNPQAKARDFGGFAACSIGPMQVMYETAVEEGFDGPPEDLFDPAKGIAAGCVHLARLMTWAEQDHQKALGAYSATTKALDDEALGAYNAGQGNWNSVNWRAYAASVLRWKERLT